MKTLKTVLAVVGGLFVILFLWGALGPDEPETAAADMQTYAQGAESQSAADFYGTNTRPGSNGGGNPNATGQVQHLNAARFRQLVADYNGNKNTYIGQGPCIVDFYATWCGPCKQLSPVLDRMAAKYAGKVAIYKIDIDQVGDVSNAYGVQSIPTLLYCVNGQPIDMVTGAPDEASLDEYLSQF